jgi:hypothetical protein
VRSIRSQCHNAKVAFFFKQWGGVRKSETGRELDGQPYDEYPNQIIPPVPDLQFRQNELENLNADFV